MKDSIPILKIYNAYELRFVLPIAPFGAIGQFVIIYLLYLVGVLDSVNIYIIYFLAFLLGLIVSELLYFYKSNKFFFYKDKFEVIRGGKVKKHVLYKRIKEVKFLKRFVLGGGPSNGKESYILVELEDGNIERLVFEGFFQRKYIQMALSIREENGVKVSIFE